ncbi:hypothetical protein E5161_09420 [Cohnella pontilimi]|uniref:Dynamin N-terminal domain-containing protein n=1 Tax=Cohnella pontilimi TaxID=2564100 RepID=A0A4V5LSA1_9BACL|nr:dynamin family protein [Cohnella pontilimi]TJY42219.1 hypothetical protein E5161_09420 [Cohnella pontilimi]
MIPARDSTLVEWVGEFRNSTEKLLPDSSALAKMRELFEDMEQDYYTIVVAGEFKHGKSTFVNALLGEQIMPSDVTPTTATLNAVFYGSQPQVHVLKTDGGTEIHELTSGILERYTANADFNPDEIHHLKIFYPSSLLENRIVLVDTPGVNDLNQHRAAITHRFIPRADIIILMLSMTAPLNGTEQSFIQQYLLRHGTDHILFAANFSDRIDEEEEEETMELLRRRLERITGNPNPLLFKLSARDALAGRLQSKEELILTSGIQAVEEAIRSKLIDGEKAKAKVAGRKWRFQLALQELMQEIEAALALSEESMEGLQAHLDNIGIWKSRQAQWEEQLIEYIRQHEDEIAFMALKSFDFFGEKLRAEAEQRVQFYQGSDIKGLTESQLPMLIRLEFSHWLDQNTDAIQQLLLELEKAVSAGLMQSFRESVQIRGYREVRINVDLTDTLNVNGGGNPHVKAGLLVGGASSIALMLGGTFLIPIIGMAGLPFLQHKMAEKKLESMKPDVILALNSHLDTVYDKTRVAIRSYIAQAVYEIHRQSIEEFNRLIRGMESAVQNELSMKRNAAEREHHFQKELKELLGKAFQSIETLKEDYV